MACLEREHSRHWRDGSVAQSCLTLWDPKGYSPPGSSVHGILQVRLLEWVATPSSGGSSRLRDPAPVWLRCRQSLYLLCQQGSLPGRGHSPAQKPRGGSVPGRTRRGPGGGVRGRGQGTEPRREGGDRGAHLWPDSG